MFSLFSFLVLPLPPFGCRRLLLPLLASPASPPLPSPPPQGPEGAPEAQEAQPQRGWSPRRRGGPGAQPQPRPFLNQNNEKPPPPLFDPSDPHCLRSAATCRLSDSTFPLPSLQTRHTLKTPRCPQCPRSSSTLPFLLCEESSSHPLFAPPSWLAESACIIVDSEAGRMLPGVNGTLTTITLYSFYCWPSNFSFTVLTCLSLLFPLTPNPRPPRFTPPRAPRFPSNPLSTPPLTHDLKRRAMPTCLWNMMNFSERHSRHSLGEGKLFGTKSEWATSLRRTVSDWDELRSPPLLFICVTPLLSLSENVEFLDFLDSLPFAFFARLRLDWKFSRDRFWRRRLFDLEIRDLRQLFDDY